MCWIRAKELCEEEGGLGSLIPPPPPTSPSLINHTFSVDKKHHGIVCQFLGNATADTNQTQRHHSHPDAESASGICCVPSSMLLYVHRGTVRTTWDGEPRTSTSAFTQPLSLAVYRTFKSYKNMSRMDPRKYQLTGHNNNATKNRKTRGRKKGNSEGVQFNSHLCTFPSHDSFSCQKRAFFSPPSVMFNFLPSSIFRV